MIREKECIVIVNKQFCHFQEDIASQNYEMKFCLNMKLTFI